MEKDIFCKIIDGEVDSKTCYEDEVVKCIMDVSPVAPGHMLIIPKRHFTTILDMDDTTIVAIHNVAKKMIKKMENVLPNLTGVKVVVNYGSEQAVKHYHMHLLPYYSKNTTLTQEEISNMLKD